MEQGVPHPDRDRPPGPGLTPTNRRTGPTGEHTWNSCTDQPVKPALHPTQRQPPPTKITNSVVHGSRLSHLAGRISLAGDFEFTEAELDDMLDGST